MHERVLRIQSLVMRTDALRRLFFLLCPLLAAAGCQRPQYPTIPQLDHGLVWIFPGVEGGNWSLSWAKEAFRDAGCEAAFRVHDWSHPLGIIVNLVAYERNRADAAQIAADIVEYRGVFRGGPIDLVGYSGGGGIAVMVAEALPESIRLRNVILVQPALSPEYDLTAALRHIDGKLVNFHSPYDYVFLGAGTHLLGTMDRKHTSSAGKDGFDLGLAVPDLEIRDKVEQRTWSSEMADTGHIGMHLGILLYEWNFRYVAPYLLSNPEPIETRTARRASTQPSADEIPSRRAEAARSQVRRGADPPRRGVVGASTKPAEAEANRGQRPFVQPPPSRNVVHKKQ